jgi:hypothetical protein
MFYRYSYFTIDSPLDEIWLDSLDFWGNEKGNFIYTYISENRFHRKLKFKRDPSGKFLHNGFILSLGETYLIEFGLNSVEKCTYILIEVEFRWGGGDNMWRIPQECVDKWLDHLGFESTPLQRGKSANYLQISDVMETIEKQKIYYKFCPICGSKLRGRYDCQDCGYLYLDLLANP